MWSAVVVASVFPKVAFQNICRVKAAVGVEKELEDELDVPPAGMETIDTKLSAAVDAVISGSVAADIAVLFDRSRAKVPSLMLSGRRKLRVMYISYATGGNIFWFYSLIDIQSIKLH